MARITILCACVAALSAPAAAHASATQLAVFQDDRRLMYSGAERRELTLDELRRLGVDVVKVHAYWSEMAPGGARKPRGFEGWKVEDYPAGRFERLDGLVRGASVRGMRVMIAPTGPAPGWATRKRDGATGTWRPSAREYGRFVRALATRYDGAHADPDGRPLPRVRIWSIWNEPNHPLFLLPLGSSDRDMHIAPHTYRGLVRFAVAGLHLAGHRRDSVLFGELLPIGRSRPGVRNTIKPVHFIREMLCLDESWRPYRGRAARVRDCDRFRRLTGVTGFAYHPYTRPSGPRTPEPTEYDATIRSLDRIARALDRAAARGRVRRGLGIYNTEFGFQSNPPDPSQTPLGRIPGFLNESEWMSFRNPRVKSWSQYALGDDPLRDEPGAARYRGYQTGLYFADGRRKRAVYDAWRMPVHVRLVDERTVELWGGVRQFGSHGRAVRVQQRGPGGGYRNLGKPIVIRNYRGYFTQRLRISGASRRLFRVRYVTPEGRTLTSRSARAEAR